jgi:hypothetical protein
VTYRELPASDDPTTTRLEYSVGGEVPTIVVVSWRGWWRDGVVAVADGDVLGTLSDEASFLRGGAFTLRDGRVFSFRLHRGWSGQRYVATLDGRELTGPVADEGPLPFAARLLFVLGAHGVVTAIREGSGLYPLGALISGAASLVLLAGAFRAIEGKAWPLRFATGWYMLNGLAGWMVVFGNETERPWGQIVAGLSGIFLAFLFARWAARATEQPPSDRG